MMTKRKPQRRQGKPHDPAAHQRMAHEIGRLALVAPMLVDDPWPDEQGAKIVVLRNLRDDPLGERHARRTIDEAQYLAGRDYQRDFEAAGGGSVRAIDFTKEAVDGGCLPDPISLARMRATERLGVAHRALGLDGTAIVQSVLVHRLTSAQVASARGMPAKREYFSQRLAECLDTLAEVYRYAMPRVM